MSTTTDVQGDTGSGEDTRSGDDAERGHFGPDGSDGGDGRHMGPLDSGHTHGPTNSQYFTIFWVLLGITALEVSTYWWDDWLGEGSRTVGVVVLLICMAIKFSMIAALFMHLRFDAKLLQRIFVFGLFVAVVVYAIALTSMRIWVDSGNPWFNNPPPEITTTTTAPPQ